MKAAILELAELGVTTFLKYGMGQFDFLAARCLCQMKETHTQLHSILVLAYLDSSPDTALLPLFDEILFPALEHCPKAVAIPKRNHYMVDSARYAICFVPNTPGGAGKTLLYAKKKGLILLQKP